MPTHHYADVNGVRLHYAAEGQGPLLMFVHGFPEFWYAWQAQLAEFGRDHFAVAPDMRGYNLSSKPAELDSYAVPLLVEDLVALADHLGHRRFTLVAHDWGGAIAWAVALLHPDRLERLVIVNAPHPAIFQRLLAEHPGQQKASQYMLFFRGAEAEATLAADNFALLRQMVLGEGQPWGWATEADRIAYLEAWAQPGRAHRRPQLLPRCARRPARAGGDAAESRGGPLGVGGEGADTRDLGRERYRAAAREPRRARPRRERSHHPPRRQRHPLGRARAAGAGQPSHP